MAPWEAHPHRRLNSLTGEWVLVSPQRTARPWQGQVEAPATVTEQTYDPNCYLCPGNSRAGGERNPNYSGTFAFTNDFAALAPDTSAAVVNDGDLLVAESERGVCRVLCFSPRHDLTMPRMGHDEIRGVIDAWCAETQQLRALPFIHYVQIFENRGALMGASNPHPHCQIWAGESLPNEIRKEHLTQQQYRRTHGSCLLCDYVAREKASGPRLVYENAGFVIVVPFWANWPYETLLVSKHHVSTIDQLTSNARDELADALKHITTLYDNLFEAPFPYSLGIHQQPTAEDPDQAWHLHAHFFPPLLRSATVRKFMVGYELLAMPQRDISPEWAAQRLRSLPAVHYLRR